MTPLQLGLGIHWRAQPLAEIRELIEEGERLGYASLWIANDKFYHDMYVTAAMAAAWTSRICIGTFVSDPYSIHPALSAMAIATLDEVSGGRAMLCMGAGGTGFPEMGIERRKPALAIREAVEIVRAMLAGRRVSFRGEIVSLDGGRLGFGARPNIPLLVASRGERVYRAAGRVADGVMIATFAEPTGINHARRNIGEGCARAGRTLNDMTLMSRVDTCIHPDRQIAYEAVKPSIATCLWASYPDREFVRRLGLQVPEELEALIAKRDYGLVGRYARLVPDSFVAAFAWAGTSDDVAAQLRRVVYEAGIRALTIMPIPCSGASELDVAQRFAHIANSLDDWN